MIPAPSAIGSGSLGARFAAEVFFRTFNRESPDGYAIGSPSQHQIDDAAYKVSTFRLK